MLKLFKIFLLLFSFNLICGKTDKLDAEVMSRTTFMQWPNAEIPFYIDSEHFDHEQSLKIMTALSNFAFKTCLKFAPVMVRPKEDQHVMLFINPDGIKRCKIDTSGHSAFGPHQIHLGYECLQSPQIDMMIMRALGFPFEHNRIIRDLYIKVLTENIEPSAMELFTKDNLLPAELRVHPYDINSVMHFGQREYSKNGHKTIVFKKHNIQQNRIGLSENDLKKIQLIYGPECQKRDRQEQLELCQSYPGVVRKKRDIESNTTLKSLRANRDITPPEPLIEEKMDDVDGKSNEESEISKKLKILGIEDEAQDILDRIYKISAKALKNAREKYCNSTEVYKSIAFNKGEKRNDSDIIGILDYIAEYADNMIANSMLNLTIFCENADSINDYQRQICDWRFNSRCTVAYKSTKSGFVMYSTQHRPYIVQSTKHRGQAASYSYDKFPWRARNDSEETTTPQIQVRKKREVLIKDKFVLDEPQKDMIEKDKEAISKTNFTSNGSTNGRRILQNPYKIKEKYEKFEQDSESKISDEAHPTLDTKKIQHPPSLALKTNNLAFRNGPQTQDFREPSKKATAVHGDTAEPVESEDTDEDTVIIQEDKNNHKNKFENKNTFDFIEQRKKIKAKRLEKTSRNSLLYQNRAVFKPPPIVKLSKLNREFYNERRWLEGVVRYVISPLEGYDLSDMRNRLEEVGNILKSKTCVRLEEMSEEEAMNYEDYLVLDTSPDYVTGRVGGRQNFGSIELFKGGQHRQHTAMMVMAMLGFYFEVSRHDRDKYIRVHMRHIRPDKLHHFEKIRDEATLDLPYDFKSATHPAWQFWRKIGKTGISTVATYKTLDPDGSIMRNLGQHEQLLSNFDIIKINSVYNIDCFIDPDEP